MLSRVWGRCDNYDIIFTNASGNLWTVTVPASQTTAFYVEVYAEDTAGNTAYVATILITHDSTDLAAKVYIQKIGNAVLIQEIFGEAALSSGITADVEAME